VGCSGVLPKALGLRKEGDRGRGLASGFDVRADPSTTFSGFPGRSMIAGRQVGDRSSRQVGQWLVGRGVAEVGIAAASDVDRTLDAPVTSNVGSP
jgi:hypothetical protein